MPIVIVQRAKRSQGLFSLVSVRKERVVNVCGKPTAVFLGLLVLFADKCKTARVEQLGQFGSPLTFKHIVHNVLVCPHSDIAYRFDMVIIHIVATLREQERLGQCVLHALHIVTLLVFGCYNVTNRPNEFAGFFVAILDDNAHFAGIKFARFVSTTTVNGVRLKEIAYNSACVHVVNILLAPAVLCELAENSCDCCHSV